jgi:hypothetical protein
VAGGVYQVLWLASRRLAWVNIRADAAPPVPKCIDREPRAQCPDDCSGHGLCVAGR